MVLFASGAGAQEVNAVRVANGKSALEFAIAQDVHGPTERGYMDIIVVLSDRKLSASDIADAQRSRR